MSSDKSDLAVRAFRENKNAITNWLFDNKDLWVKRGLTIWDDKLLIELNNKLYENFFIPEPLPYADLDLINKVVKSLRKREKPKRKYIPKEEYKPKGEKSKLIRGKEHQFKTKSILNNELGVQDVFIDKGKIKFYERNSASPYYTPTEKLNNYIQGKLDSVVKSGPVKKIEIDETVKLSDEEMKRIRGGLLIKSIKRYIGVNHFLRSLWVKYKHRPWVLSVGQMEAAETIIERMEKAAKRKAEEREKVKSGQI